jgi:hypothetical protein
MLRRIVMRVILPKGYPPNPGHTYKAKPHEMFNAAKEEEAVDDFAEYLDRGYPCLDFRYVRVGPGRYNFICTGPRTKENREENTLDSERR